MQIVLWRHGWLPPVESSGLGYQLRMAEFMGQNQLLEFARNLRCWRERRQIRGHVVYNSTRPFDDPALLLQLTWEPQVRMSHYLYRRVLPTGTE